MKTRMFRNAFVALLLLLIPHTPLFAADQPCGVIAVNYFSALPNWTRTDQPLYDLNSDGIVDVLDLMIPAACVRGLAPGLNAFYYGFENGDPDQDITFPDFNAIPVDPVVVEAVDQIAETSGWNGFLTSRMRRNFAAVFEGYLYAPESANYTLEITGSEGARVYLNGDLTLSFDGNPPTDSNTGFLEQGLHPIRIEYYADRGWGSLTFSWSSDGSVISAQQQVINQNFLFHGNAEIPEHATANIRIVYDTPSGGTTEATRFVTDANILSASTNVRLWMDGEEQVVHEGKINLVFDVQPGLNSRKILIEDERGNRHESEFHVYKRGAPVVDTGLTAKIYQAEWYDGLIPRPETLRLQRVLHHNSLTLVRNSDSTTNIAGVPYSDGTIVQLQGVINILEGRNYRFRINGPGVLKINGETVAAIGWDYIDQWQDDGELYLTAGHHKIEMITGDRNDGPAMRVYLEWDGQEEIPFPDGYLLRHGTDIIDPPPTANQNSFGRVPAPIAEYLMKPGAWFEDTSGNGHHLVPDPRAVPRATGGMTFTGPAMMSSLPAGIILARQAAVSGRFTLEIDFQVDNLISQRRELISLSTPQWFFGARISISNNDIFFEVDDTRNEYQLRADDWLVAGQRHHIFCTVRDGVAYMYINGILRRSLPVDLNLYFWPNTMQLNVSQPFRRTRGPRLDDDQHIGHMMLAAAYSKGFDQNMVHINTNLAPLSRVPVPNPILPTLTPVQFPPVSATQAQVDEAVHILDRLTFGASPDEINRIIGMGVDNWINEQLDPLSIDDSEVEAHLATDLFMPHHAEEDLRGEMLYRMIKSKRQLLEVMTWFWENHFNTQISKTRSLVAERDENNRFREHALGNFKDLLTASATHYPMTVYLDSSTNVVGAANENFAREILELHTYGVNNGYTEDDIVELARCFTGWAEERGAFFFNPGQHDYGPKSLLGLELDEGGGFADGMFIIDYLTKSRETADYISWKLCQVFIADDPPADVVQAASDAFFNSEGDIESTLRAIFTHARFRTDLAYRGNKVRTPLEFITAVMRKTEAYPVTQPLNHYLERMGMVLFDYADPTGFSEEGVDWVDTNSMLERWNFVNDLTSNRGYAMAPSLDLYRFFGRHGGSDHNTLLDFFESLTTHGNHPAGLRAITENWLTEGNPDGFDINPDTLDGRIRQTLSMYLRLPEVNVQ